MANKTCLLSMLVLTVLLSPALAGLARAAGPHGSDDAQNQSPTTGRVSTADKQTIQNVLDIYARAMEEKSVPLMEQAIVTENFSTIESGYPNWNWNDFRDNHLLVEMNTFTDVDYTIEVISGELQDSLGFALYRYTASGKIQGKPDTVSISGLGTAILAPTPNGWRIRHLHTSAPRTQLEGAKR